MSHILWSLYWTDNVDKFQRLLAPTSYSTQPVARSPNVGPGSGSYGAFGTSPRAVAKTRKTSGYGTSFGNAKSGSGNFGRSEINSRDHAGLTILLRAASSTSDNAIAFVLALLDHPAIDIYAQDPESGWNALHRALYSGNISIARLLLEKERRDLTSHTAGASLGRVGQLIKTKDHEGNSPFDLYNSTIGERELGILDDSSSSSGDSSDSHNEREEREERPMSVIYDRLQPWWTRNAAGLQVQTDGDELFSFGSNKNLNLGLGDEDDRQYPERVYLKRPDHLIQRFYHETSSHLDQPSPAPTKIADIPALIQSRPLVIHDVVLSKLHSAVLTADPVSNLYICGVGRSGRLGLGDEATRFNFTPVQGGLADKKVTKVALGQNHTMAITDSGELWTWGSNAYSQLGYALPTPVKRDEEPISTTPRQVFGPLKKEMIVGVAASAIHSVAHTDTSLYCWGKNIGQLALMDADSRSLEVQQIPRKVAASLFSTSIVMVSAMDKATTCLLANHTVCVFTSYGYNIVKFPFAEVATSLQPSRRSMSNRYDPGRNQISYLASGGETIAALTGSGDLFTMNVTQKTEPTQQVTSTTNPSKIRGAVSQPQCIWSARKEGVRSVDVGEHGSVIICTRSGAVWRRVKRAKAKDSHVTGSADSKRKDFKFQRVPCITNVVSVRSSVFGAMAAVRKSSDVIKEQVHVGEQTLWTDVAPLLSLQDFRSSEPSSRENDPLKFWDKEALQERLSPVAYQVLKSPHLEEDLEQYLAHWAYGNEPLSMVARTSTAPELEIPVHNWMLSARSSVLRDGFTRSRKEGSYEHPEVFNIEMQSNKTVVTFLGLDTITLLNLILFAYEDKVIPAWNFTRQAPQLADRYRQIRPELMKLAMRLNMPNLEVAVRNQTEPKRCMNEDFKLATKNRSFFDDTDAIIELDGAEVPVHSVFLCQRCPWFRGLFMGRSGGLWLATRRESETQSEKVKLDLKHMDPDAFRYVLQYLYADIGEELFDQVVSETIDDFTDLVMDVMSIANELMLDRLSQICQRVMGRFVNTRNIAHFLNAVGPCSVTAFKDAGLEYVCLQMESMLENHLLDDLDAELLLELDEAVRANQLAQMPFAKSGRAELQLHEENPELSEDVDEERQRRVREMAYKASQKDDERKASSSFKARMGSLDEAAPITPTPSRTRRRSKAGRNEPFSPHLRPKSSQADLIFDMEEEDSSELGSPLGAAARQQGQTTTTTTADPTRRHQPNAVEQTGLDDLDSPFSSPLVRRALYPALAKANSTPEEEEDAQKGGNPWGSSALPTTKLDLREIMSEATTTKSAISVGLAAERSTEAVLKAGAAKMSQKERKKQQQLQASQAPRQDSTTRSNSAWESPSTGARGSPWKMLQAGQGTPTKEKPAPMNLKPPIPPNTKHLSAADASSPIPRRTASPDTRFSGQSRIPSSPVVPSSSRPSTKAVTATTSAAVPASASASAPAPAPAPLVPHSRTYIKPAPKAEPSLGVSMADIIGQQQREQQIVKEAVAKRSLQEIQQEQEFDAWWDQESRRTQEEEARRLAREKEKEEGKNRGRRGRGGKPRGGGSSGAGGRGGRSNAEGAGSSKRKGGGGGGAVKSS